MNQSIHGRWDSVNGPVSPRRNRLREWTRTYDKMRSKWDDVDLLPVTLSTSVTPVFPYTRSCSVKMNLQSVIERVWRCTWTL